MIINKYIYIYLYIHLILEVITHIIISWVCGLHRPAFTTFFSSFKHYCVFYASLSLLRIMFKNPVKTGFSLGSLLGNVGWHNSPVVVKGSVCFMMLFVCWAHGHVQWFILFMRQNGSLHWFHVAFVIFMSIWINIPSKRSKVIHDPPCHSCHIGPISRLRGTGVATCCNLLKMNKLCPGFVHKPWVLAFVIKGHRHRCF